MQVNVLLYRDATLINIQNCSTSTARTQIHTWLLHLYRITTQVDIYINYCGSTSTVHYAVNFHVL